LLWNLHLESIGRRAESKPALKYEPVRDSTSKTAPRPYIEIGKRATSPANVKLKAPGSERIF